jgi:hypothetical protein
MLRQTLTLSLLLTLLGACGDRNAPAPEATTAATPTPEAAAPSQPAGDSSAPVGPISSRGDAVADSQSAAPSGSIEFDLPASWEKKPPSSSMRLAQATIPGPGGPVELAVFFFGTGGGGGVEANIDRWIGQMETTDQPKPETFEAGGLKVTWVDVKGTLKPGQMGMSNTTEPISNARLYGAVVEGPGGPWFFKAAGPDATLGPQRDAFVTMLKSVRAKA